MIHLNVHPITPQQRFLEQAVTILTLRDGIAAYPTDTVYGMGAAVSNAKAINRIAELLHRDTSLLFSFICSDFSQLSPFVTISNAHYKLMRRLCPGPYTFILPASSLVQKRISRKRKEVGVRIPDNEVCRELTRMLGEPLANISVPVQGISRGSAEEVKNAVSNIADIMLDIGDLDNPDGSTIINLTTEEPVLIRQGKGSWEGIA